MKAIVRVKNDRRLKRLKKSHIKHEDKEAQEFDKRYSKLIQDFNVWLFSDTDGSFVEFDLRYRRLALADWIYIQPDPNEFFNYAIKQ